MILNIPYHVKIKGIVAVVVHLLSYILLFVTPQTAAPQASLHHLPDFAQTHVRWFSDAIQLSYLKVTVKYCKNFLL